MLLNKKQQQATFASSYLTDNRLSAGRFSQDGIAKIIQNLDPNKAHGHE